MNLTLPVFQNDNIKITTQKESHRKWTAARQNYPCDVLHHILCRCACIDHPIAELGDELVHDKRDRGYVTAVYRLRTEGNHPPRERLELSRGVPKHLSSHLKRDKKKKK